MRITTTMVLAGALVFLGAGRAPAQVEPVAEEVCEVLGGCATCKSDLSECEADLASCNAALDECQFFPATGQNRQVVDGEDGNPAFGAPLAYQDNGDGTITDLNTGLVWEKKVARDGTPVGSNLHDADNQYPWRGSCSNDSSECGTDADCSGGATCDASDGQGTGLTIFEWVAELNAQNFAGHSDWRVPNLKELQSIVDYATFNPSIDPAFHGPSCGSACTDMADPDCACTVSLLYWSSTTNESLRSAAWIVSFNDGFVFDRFKTTLNSVRAVRGGS